MLCVPPSRGCAVIVSPTLPGAELRARSLPGHRDALAASAILWGQSHGAGTRTAPGSCHGASGRLPAPGNRCCHSGSSRQIPHPQGLSRAFLPLPRLCTAQGSQETSDSSLGVRAGEEVVCILDKGTSSPRKCGHITPAVPWSSACIEVWCQHISRQSLMWSVKPPS